MRVLPRRRPPGDGLRRIADLEREIRIGLGGATIQLDDVVRNDGFAPTPHMILYHVNVGWPLLGSPPRSSRASASPASPRRQPQAADWRTDRGRRASRPRSRFWELRRRPDAEGLGRAAVLNPDIGDGRPLGVELAWSHETSLASSSGA